MSLLTPVRESTWVFSTLVMRSKRLAVNNKRKDGWLSFEWSFTMTKLIVAGFWIEYGSINQLKYKKRSDNGSKFFVMRKRSIELFISFLRGRYLAFWIHFLKQVVIVEYFWKICSTNNQLHIIRRIKVVENSGNEDKCCDNISQTSQSNPFHDFDYSSTKRYRCSRSSNSSSSISSDTRRTTCTRNMRAWRSMSIWENSVKSLINNFNRVTFGDFFATWVYTYIKVLLVLFALLYQEIV